jgi:hypothetical protein
VWAANEPDTHSFGWNTKGPLPMTSAIYL